MLKKIKKATWRYIHTIEKRGIFIHTYQAKIIQGVNLYN